jgi:hypothetical protein
MSVQNTGIYNNLTATTQLVIPTLNVPPTGITPSGQMYYVTPSATLPQGPQGSIYVSTGSSYIQVGAQGNVGQNGAQGVQGFSGYVGYQGISNAGGAEGNQGYQGQPGGIGPQGANATFTINGNTGIQGYVGYQGNQGLQGGQGTQGYQGFTGPQGSSSISPGVQGAQGQTGLPGQGVGAQGNQGNQGAQGNQGFQGQIGNPLAVTGAQGNQGKPGNATVVSGVQSFIGGVGAITILGESPQQPPNPSYFSTVDVINVSIESEIFLGLNTQTYFDIVSVIISDSSNIPQYLSAAIINVYMFGNMRYMNISGFTVSVPSSVNGQVRIYTAPVTSTGTSLLSSVPITSNVPGNTSPTLFGPNAPNTVTVRTNGASLISVTCLAILHQGTGFKDQYIEFYNIDTATNTTNGGWYPATFNFGTTCIEYFSPNGF